MKLKSVFGTILAASVLSGCVTVLTVDKQKKEDRLYTQDQAMAPLALHAGDRFRFDNPDVTWTVTSTQKDKINWESDTGAQQVTTQNPLLPAISWESAQGTGNRLLSLFKGSFFPLEEGKKISFRSTVSSDKPPYTWEFDWNCEVVNETRINLPVGIFDTFRIECSRQQPEKWTFYYAPSLGYYVMMEQLSRKGGRPQRRVLLGYDRNGVVVGNLSGRRDGGSLYAIGEQDAVSSNANELSKIHSSEELPPLMVDAENGTYNGQNSNVTILEASPDGATALSRRGVLKSTNGDSIQARVNPPSREVISVLPSQTQTRQAPVRTQTQVSNREGVLPAGHYVHLASYNKLTNLERGWAEIQSKSGGMLSVLFPYQQPVTIPSKGRFIRLLAGPLGNKAEAKQLCSRLASKNQYCKPFHQK